MLTLIDFVILASPVFHFMHRTYAQPARGRGNSAANPEVGTTIFYFPQNRPQVHPQGTHSPKPYHAIDWGFVHTSHRHLLRLRVFIYLLNPYYHPHALRRKP